MKLRSIEQVRGFIKAVDNCKGSVWIKSPDGNQINLKSKFSQYVAIGKLLEDNYKDFELFCSKEDEGNFFDFFKNNPKVLS